MRKAHIIFIHGISDRVITGNYSGALAENIVSRIKQKISPDIMLEDYLTFENINYSEIGQAEEDYVYRAYLKDSGDEYNILDKTIERLALGNLRKELITSISDVLAYESDFWREKIRDTVRDKITPFVGTDTMLTVVGHSLGSVVGFDTLYYNCRHNDLWCNQAFKVHNFYTMGSPLALFTLELDNTTGEQKPRYIPLENMPPEMDPRNTNPDLRFLDENGEWVNFYDAQDLIGYPLATLFKDKFFVQDHLIQTGTNPVTAHNKYWENDTIADQIANKVFSDMNTAVANSRGKLV